MQQNVAILAQISQQLSSIAPQVTIPPTPPPPFPTFKPLSSDILVNVFWFMALICSLSAALLAILVQQWVRDYMQVFERYSDSLKKARLRQYLYDGCDGWYMPVLADAVPGLLHVSLFLFFAGLVDFILNINTTVGVTTTIPIGISTLFYIFTTFAPVIHPQSPYQNSFSGLIWYAMQKLRGRRYTDRGPHGAQKFVSSNMAEGQMQLAMEETPDRKLRDARAISWLTKNMTEDAEMESFAMAIPGSFNTEWGIEVWKGVSISIEENKSTDCSQLTIIPHTDMHRSTPIPPTVATPRRISTGRNLFNHISHLVTARRANTSGSVIRVSLSSPHPSNYPASVLSNGSVQPTEAIQGLCRRVGRLLETCNSRGHFASEELWRKRTHACIESTALLVCCANADLDWFGDIRVRSVLSEKVVVETIDQLSKTRLDPLFVARWTCLSIVDIKLVLRRSLKQSCLATAVSCLADVQGGDGTVDDRALSAAKKIDGYFNRVWDDLNKLSCLLLPHRQGSTEEQLQAKLRSHESQMLISELERINTEIEYAQDPDIVIFPAWQATCDVTRKLTCQLPGVQFNARIGSTSFSQAVHLFRTPTKQLWILPSQQLRGLCSIAPGLRDIMEAGNGGQHQGTLESLKTVREAGGWFYEGRLMERQLSRLQDLRDSGGFGLTVEMFFVTIRELPSTSWLEESHYALYVGALKWITSDWKKCRHSLGTQKIVLDVVYDLAIQLPMLDPPSDSDFSCPSQLTDMLLVLLGNILEGQTGSHIDDAVQRLQTLHTPFMFPGTRRKFLEKAFEVISRTQAPANLPTSS
jgi:hypothetical protein